MKLIIALTLSFSIFASQRLVKPVKYKSYYGKCPSIVAGKLSLELVKVFEKRKSLKDVKKHILKNNLKQKFYLSSYKVSYEPQKDLLKFNYSCPKALMKAQIYKDNGEEFYTAILVETGELFDPSYELVLRREKLINQNLPELALPVKALDSKLHHDITRLSDMMSRDLKKKISEIILDDKNDLTIIFSVRNRPTSAFLGQDYWSDKIEKLEKILAYTTKKKSTPSVINLTNAKKVVVKFPGAH